MKEIFGMLGVAFVIGSSIPYALALWRGEAKPHAFTWLLWSVINLVVLAAQIAEDARSGAWPTVISAAKAMAIGLYALKRGELRYRRSDWIFLLSALAAIPLWIATDDPLWSVLLVCVIDVLAFLPTVWKSWIKPWQESAAAFAMGALGFFFSLLAIENWSFVNYAYPALVFISNFLFVMMLLRRRKTAAA